MKTATIIIVSMFWLSAAAMAGPSVQFTGVYGQNVNIGGTWYNGWVRAGTYELLVDGLPMKSFCADLGDFATYSAVEYNWAALADIADSPFGPMGAADAGMIAAAWSAWNLATVTQAQAAAAQVFIWEVTADDTFDLTSGSFYLNSTDPGAQGIYDNLPCVPQPVCLAGLTHPCYQDYVVECKIPAPGTLLLGSIGAGLVCLMRRRHSIICC